MKTYVSPTASSFILFQVLALILLIAGSGMAQSTAPTATPTPDRRSLDAPKRRKLKDFGFSLERLKRDSPKKPLASRKSKKKSQTVLDEGDVIRIESNLVTSEVLVVDDKGNFIQNITPDDLVVTEDGEP